MNLSSFPNTAATKSGEAKVKIEPLIMSFLRRSLPPKHVKKTTSKTAPAPLTLIIKLQINKRTKSIVTSLVISLFALCNYLYIRKLFF